mmetsp:Transcript_1431/g.3927  ORF Transcript_1431/g.3927 Transcript_1431/m.3927 type:complete len:546 (-) Transcript_1431:800-2437(-)
MARGGGGSRQRQRRRPRYPHPRSDGEDESSAADVVPTQRQPEVAVVVYRPRRQDDEDDDDDTKQPSQRRHPSNHDKENHHADHPDAHDDGTMRRRMTTWTRVQIPAHVRRLPDRAFRRRPFLMHVEVVVVGLGLQKGPPPSSDNEDNDSDENDDNDGNRSDKCTTTTTTASAHVVDASSSSWSAGSLLESIGSDCFAGCRSLQSFTVRTVPPLPTKPRRRTTATMHGRTPPQSRSPPPHSQPSTPPLHNLVRIGTAAWQGCTRLQRLDLSATGVTVLRSRTLANCPALQRLLLPHALRRLGPHVVTGGTSLRGIHLPDTVTEIGDGAFSGCTALTHLRLPRGRRRRSRHQGNNGSTPNSSAMTTSDCHPPDKNDDDDGLTIGHGAFWNCANLRTIQLPATRIRRLGASTFACCPAICSMGFYSDNDNDNFSDAKEDTGMERRQEQHSTAAAVRQAVELKWLELLSAPKKQTTQTNNNKNDRAVNTNNHSTTTTWFSSSSPLYRMGLRSKTELGSQPETTTLRTTCVFTLVQHNAARFSSSSSSGW